MKFWKDKFPSKEMIYELMYLYHIAAGELQGITSDLNFRIAIRASINWKTAERTLNAFELRKG
jgi:hypothetical protein